MQEGSGRGRGRKLSGRGGASGRGAKKAPGGAGAGAEGSGPVAKVSGRGRKLSAAAAGPVRPRASAAIVLLSSDSEDASDGEGRAHRGPAPTADPPAAVWEAAEVVGIVPPPATVAAQLPAVAQPPAPNSDDAIMRALTAQPAGLVGRRPDSPVVAGLEPPPAAAPGPAALESENWLGPESPEVDFVDLADGPDYFDGEMADTGSPVLATHVELGDARDGDGAAAVLGGIDEAVGAEAGVAAEMTAGGFVHQTLFPLSVDVVR